MVVLLAVALTPIKTHQLLEVHLVVEQVVNPLQVMVQMQPQTPEVAAVAVVVIRAQETDQVVMVEMVMWWLDT